MSKWILGVRPIAASPTVNTMDARTGSHRLSLVTCFVLAAALVLSWLGGCSDSVGPAGMECDTGCGLAKELTVSDPLVTATSAGTAAPASARATAVVTDWQVFVSLPPGTHPADGTALVRNRRTGDSVLTSLSSGGFDPVAITAIAGDTVEVFVNGNLQFTRIVSSARRPVVVRTEPPPRKRDQPLNAAIVIVFSEPVDGGSLTPSTVQLLRNGVPVAGSITMLPGGVMATFKPTNSLAPLARYEILVTTDVHDLEGLGMETPARVAFTTGRSATGAPASLSVYPDTIWIPAGTTYQMTATVRDAAGTALFDQPVSWFVDTMNATISSTGVFVPRAAGNYEITALLGNLAASAYAGVRPSDARSLTLAPTSGTIGILDTIILAATVRDSADVPIPGTVVTWRTTDSTVAMIAASGFGPSGEALGTVTGLNPGNVTITATIGTASASAAITVTVPHVGSVTVSPDTATLLVPRTIQLRATVRDSSGKVMAGQPLTWTSANPAFATVSSDGLVNSVSEGLARVIAASRGVSDTALIRVTVNGHLTVTTTTTGAAADLDSSGYTFGVDIGNGQPTIPIAMNGAFTIDTLAPGVHVVKLGQIALNCAVSENNPQVDTLASGGRDTVAFHVACAPHAAIVVTTVTTGIDVDPTYRVVLDSGTAGQFSATIGDTGSVAFSPIAVGAHTIALGDLSLNCAASGSLSRADTVAAGATDTVAYQLTCSPVLGPSETIAFASNRDGNSEIYVRDENGLTRLTNDAASDGHPAWSPDGSKLVFTSNRSGLDQIFVMNANGTSVSQLTSDSASSDPAWSPAGTKIAFVSLRRIHVMNADGSGSTQISNDITYADFWPAWSADGSKLAFTRAFRTPNRTYLNVYAMNADGTGVTPITSDAWAPAWSPDGSKIAFNDSLGIAVMNVDGSGRTQIAAGHKSCVAYTTRTTYWKCSGGSYSNPAWSPSGDRVGFSWYTWSCNNASTPQSCIAQPAQRSYGIGVMRADGSGGVQLTATATGIEGPPAWRP